MGKRQGGDDGGGGGRGRGGRGRGGGGGREDQYGDTMMSQDRQDFSGFGSGKGQGGGGTAGGSKRGGDLSYQRQVPKFLQKYSHMLGKSQEQEEEPVIVKQPENEVEDEEQEENVEADALRRAMAENPELAAEFGDTLTKQLDKAQAAEEKEKGNQAFLKKKYPEAIASFTKCIQLDPRNEVYYSNRSAAYAGTEDYGKALEDAKAVIQLKPSWVKGWARLAAAYFGLKLFSEAKEGYEKALKIEPLDESLQKGLEKAEYHEFQQIRDKKHVFKKQKVEPTKTQAAPSKPKAILSFNEDEEDQ